MPTWCIVRGCSNSSRKLNCKHLSWHSFPTQDEVLLSQWLARVDKKEVNKNWKICSEHFEPKYIEKTLTGRRRLKKGAVPTIFKQQLGKRKGRNEGNKATKVSKREFVIGEEIVFTADQTETVLNETQGVKDAAIEVEKLQGIRRVIKELKQARIKSQTEGSLINENENVVVIQVDAATSTTLDGQETQNPFPMYFDRVSRLQAENDQLRMNLQAERKTWLQKERNLRAQWLKRENELKEQQENLLRENRMLKVSVEAEISKQKNLELQCTKEREKRVKAEKDLEDSFFVYKNICKTPKLLNYYTGFNEAEFETFLGFLGISSCESLSYEYAGLGFTVEEGQCPKGRPRGMKPRDQLVLVLCRLKMSFSERDLAVRFNISQTQVSRTCTSLMNRMQTRFKESGLWFEHLDECPGQERVPDSMKGFFPKVKTLIEGLRVYLQKSKKCSLSMVVPI